jgi:nucleoside-diphosphate-sugar epimerase
VAILRYFTVYGPRQRPDMGFRRFPAVHRGRHGRPLVVYGDGGQTREFTYVDDVVPASLLALTAPVEMEAVNIGGGRRVSLDDALELIGEALLGYRPETGLAAGLAAQAWVSQRQRAATG